MTLEITQKIAVREYNLYMANLPSFLDICTTAEFFQVLELKDLEARNNMMKVGITLAEKDEEAREKRALDLEQVRHELLMEEAEAKHGFRE